MIAKKITEIIKLIKIPEKPTAEMELKKIMLIADLRKWQIKLEDFQSNPKVSVNLDENKEQNNQVVIGDNNIQTNK